MREAHDRWPWMVGCAALVGEWYCPRWSLEDIQDYHGTQTRYPDQPAGQARGHAVVNPVFPTTRLKEKDNLGDVFYLELPPLVAGVMV